MSNTDRNEPLGLRNAPARVSVSSLPSPFPPASKPSSQRAAKQRLANGQLEKEQKKTADGKIILHPQPDDSMNDPLNWPTWRRDVALLSLGFYCCLGGGMTPVLAAGFPEVAAQYHVSTPQVALTTGLYMMGLGLGSVVASPTAILFGKRPVYLVGILLFIVSSIWCAVSSNYASLVIARIFMGFGVSPVECLPSATIAEIFYLHERAYRLGIYTLLLLSGKNLIPLVSAAIIQGLDWQWVFW
jgi:Na+/melibiose symporter-like transporter